jgi:hypothetical protein
MMFWMNDRPADAGPMDGCSIPTIERVVIR